MAYRGEVFKLHRLYVEGHVDGGAGRELLTVLFVRPFRYFFVSRVHEVLQAFRVILAGREVISVLVRRCAGRYHVADQFAVPIRRVQVVWVDLGLAGVAVVFVGAPFIQHERESLVTPYPFAGRANDVAIVFRCFECGRVAKVM